MDVKATVTYHINESKAQPRTRNNGEYASLRCDVLAVNTFDSIVIQCVNNRTVLR